MQTCLSSCQDWQHVAPCGGLSRALPLWCSTGYAGMLAEQQPNQRMQEEPMSTTQQLMLPNDAANYDAPKGGFSADPKVLPGSAESILLMACGTASVGRQTGQRFCAACKAACQSTDSKRFYWCCQAHKLAFVQVVCSDSTTSHCIVCSTMQD